MYEAISKAGIPFILFLNQEWLQYVRYSSPDFSLVTWSFERTKATKFQISPLMRRVLSTLGEGVQLQTPLEFAFLKIVSHVGLNPPKSIPLVTNAISQVFGKAVILERGTIWAVPQLQDNARFCIALLERLEAFLEIQASLLPSSREPRLHTTTRTPTAVATEVNIRDVFISHASEDKAEIARPLAEALTRRGLSVWFDEYELTLGDGLRSKIEEGLRVSRYGVTILSHSFFQKKWPQEELNALFALETQKKKILPVWHQLSASDIACYAPLLAGRLAVSTDIGVNAICEAILRAIK
jgi:hypothetical protein